MNLESQAEKVNEFFTVEGLKQNWAFLTLTSIFGLALWLRYLPEQGMQYLQALDPYYIYRASQHLAYTGGIPQTDFLMYFPYNSPFYLHNIGEIIFPAVGYWLGGSLIFNNYLEWAQFYPALMGALSTVGMYFLGKELFDKKTGVFAAFFLAVIPGVMRRTSAGFFEKEPTGTFFMMLTLLFFTRSWKYKDRLSGIISGLSLAFFSISWGGSKMLWLLMPLVVGSVLFIDEDIENLLIAYTPTVLIGGGVAASLNPGKFSFTSTFLIVNLGLLFLVWDRYLVEKLEIISKDNLKYFTPGMSALGLIALILSPLYSEFLASKVQSLISAATQSVGGDVIGSTVAENTAPGLNTIISSIGANYAGSIAAPLTVVANVLGGWPMMLIGTGLLLTGVGFMLMRKYSIVEKEISDYVYFGGLEAAFVAWSLILIGFFQQSFIFGIAAGLTVLAVFTLFTMYLDNESVFKLTTLILVSIIGLETVLFFGGSRIAYALLPASVIILSGLVYMHFNDLMKSREISLEWYKVLPALWVITNLLGAVAKSRLVFLSTFSVALAAGYGFSRIYQGISSMDFTEVFEADQNLESVKTGVLAGSLILLIGVNAAAGFVSASGVGGSPNSAWDQSLEYMDEETPQGSTIMSWWDYGYHFESIGRRPSIANGWNAGYYTGDTRAVNMPLADFLTSDNPMNTSGVDNFLEKHSVDYIVLDNTMIGKYSAVSTISNNALNLPNETGGQVNSMITLSTSSNIRDSLSTSGNFTTVRMSSRRVGTVYAPVEITNTSVRFNGAPSLQVRGQSRSMDCIITEEGTETFDVESQVPYCLAADPYYSLERGFASNQVSARGVLVPKSIMDSQLVELYLGDGANVDYAEKVEEASNGYVKMWKVEE
jgi:Uncharacterized membrane protein, required for N-linked glycosylation